ncbi:MAG: DASS family sodium-coupled anion symporter [Gammaproteobacteria bacterium]
MSQSGIEKSVRTYQKAGRVLGPLVFVLMMAFGQSQQVMDPLAWRTAAVGLWMAIWWSTEAIPVAATAFLPLVTFAPLGIMPLKAASAPYANPIIFLFMGGFMLALAVERWNLHRRIALIILSFTGTNGRNLVLGFMVVCALLSMWMTNTSTTMMLLPIVLSVIAVIRDNVDLSDKDQRNFQLAMLLGLAYSASIGGLATLIGTPPNAFLMGYVTENYGVELSFARWMLIGIPVSAVMLPIAWLLLTRWLFPVNVPANEAVNAHLSSLRENQGAMTIAEKRVAVIFLLVISLWMLRKPLSEFVPFLNQLGDAGIVMSAAILLFLIPSGDSEQAQLMTWEKATRLPWGVLILFGGGLSLASAVSGSGLALWLGQSLAPANAFGLVVLVVAAVALVIFLTELTSNLATTATLLPVMGAIALEAQVPPLMLLVPVTIAASCAFMLPVATPPNAIVFSTDEVTIPDMVRAGIVLNIIGVILVSAVALVLVPQLLPGI